MSEVWRPTGKQWNPNFPNSATELNQNRSVLPIWVNNDSNVTPSDENVVYLSTGAVKTILNVIGAVYSTNLVGRVEEFIGNARATTVDFPYLCMTNFSGSKALAVANYEDLVPHLRAQTLVYLEGQAGEATSFSGSVAGSVLTLDNNTANNDLLAMLAEWQADFGTYTNWATVDIDGTTYAITAVDASARTVTVTGSPSTGTQSATFYPHRIAGSATVARVHSWRGKVTRGAGTNEAISGIGHRDRLQGFDRRNGIGATNTNSFIYTGTIQDIPGNATNVISTTGAANVNFQALVSDPVSDGVNGDPRIGSNTRVDSTVLHKYVYVGRYKA